MCRANIKNQEVERLAKERLIEFFEQSIWPNVPPEVLGKTLDKSERERILGYGPQGV